MKRYKDYWMFEKLKFEKVTREGKLQRLVDVWKLEIKKNYKGRKIQGLVKFWEPLILGKYLIIDNIFLSYNLVEHYVFLVLQKDIIKHKKSQYVRGLK